VAERYRNTAIATAVGVSEGAVRKWLKSWGIARTDQPPSISVTETIIRDIRSHLLRGHNEREPDKYLLPDGRGRLPLPYHVGSVFQRIAEAADVTRIRVHDLRHSFGSIWAQRLPLTVLKEMMGHASIKTTERYIHTTAEVFRLTITEALSNMDEKTRKND